MLQWGAWALFLGEILCANRTLELANFSTSSQLANFAPRMAILKSYTPCILSWHYMSKMKNYAGFLDFGGPWISQKLR